MQHDWFRGLAVTVRYDDQRDLVLIVANNGRVPTLELPAASIVSAAVAGIAAALGTQLQLSRAPRAVTRAEVASLANETYAAGAGDPRGPRHLQLVQLEGTYRRGHVEGSNFDGGIQLQIAELEPGRYRVTGFLYPAFRPDLGFIGYSGPRVYPLSITRQDAA